jgi:hypothetical protein
LSATHLSCIGRKIKPGFRLACGARDRSARAKKVAINRLESRREGRWKRVAFARGGGDANVFGAEAGGEFLGRAKAE